MPGVAASPFLEQLANTPVTELCRRSSTGERPVQTLHELGIEGGLCDTVARDDVERLYAVLDLALSHGLGSIILDYVTEVCSDAFCSSRCSWCICS